LNFINKELIIFDLDGTLIDSVPDLALSVNHTLKALNKETYSLEIIRTWVGNGASTLIKRALSGDVIINKSLDEKDIEEALDIFLKFYKNNLTIGTTMYPNVKEKLNKLKSKNYKLAIVTNKPFEFIKPILDYFDLTDLFIYCIGANSLPQKKPSPIPLLHVCEKLNISVEKSIMIGDSKNDIISANEAKMQSIALTYGYNYDEDISIYNPTLICDNFNCIGKAL
jgi:phosphoglycolate phosphatase